MDEKLEKTLLEINNRYRGGLPPEVQAARHVTIHLEENGISAEERIPVCSDIIYFAELYNAALAYFKNKKN